MSPIINTVKRQHTEWEKIFANCLTDKGLISKLLENSYNSITQKQIEVTKLADFRIDIFPKKTHRWPTNA